MSNGVTATTIPTIFLTSTAMLPRCGRLSTAALTSRGMGCAEMETIADLMDQTLQEGKAEGNAAIREQVKALCETYPLPY